MIGLSHKQPHWLMTYVLVIFLHSHIILFSLSLCSCCVVKRSRVGWIDWHISAPVFHFCRVVYPKSGSRQPHSRAISAWAFGRRTHTRTHTTPATMSPHLRQRRQLEPHTAADTLACDLTYTALHWIEHTYTLQPLILLLQRLPLGWMNTRPHGLSERGNQSHVFL